MENYDYSKVLVRGDVLGRLTVPENWMNILSSIFEEEKSEAALRVVDSLGMFWEFRCTRRAGPYKKPSLQVREWKVFVRYAGLKVGDKIILLKEEHHFRATSFKIITLRNQGNGTYTGLLKYF